MSGRVVIRRRIWIYSLVAVIVGVPVLVLPLDWTLLERIHHGLIAAALAGLIGYEIGRARA